MNIKDLAKKPQLIEVIIDQEEIVKEYGDTITFWMYDHIDINTYFDFFRSQSTNNGTELNAIMRKIILNSEGQPSLAEDEILPVDIALAALTKINETLGKSRAKSST
jgi:hypothetical protein